MFYFFLFLFTFYLFFPDNLTDATAADPSVGVWQQLHCFFFAWKVSRRRSGLAPTVKGPSTHTPTNKKQCGFFKNLFGLFSRFLSFFWNFFSFFFFLRFTFFFCFTTWSVQFRCTCVTSFHFMFPNCIINAHQASAPSEKGGGDCSTTQQKEGKGIATQAEGGPRSFL